MTFDINHGKDESGFTLIELIVVFAIIGILAGVAIPAFSVWYPNYKLRSAVQDIYSNLQFTKMEAIKTRTDKTVDFSAPGQGYTKSDGVQVKFSDYGKSIAYGEGNATQKVGGGGFGGDYVTYADNKVTFNSRGFASGEGYVYVTNSKNTAYAVGSLSSGVILLKKWTGSAWE